MMNLITFAVLSIAFVEISATLQADHPDRLLELNADFYEIRDSFDGTLQFARYRQALDERILQTQFFSRIAFVVDHIQDLNSATQRQIMEHGIRIGNQGAPCIIEADRRLQNHSTDTGSELMEISNIARRDFQSIPTTFVHPYVDRTEHSSRNLLNEVVLAISRGNVVTQAEGVLQELESQQAASRSELYTVYDDIQAEIDTMRRLMNYAKAEIFPLLEYSLSYYRQGTQSILASLQTCN